jgi:TrmH family RNA methyltransferase
MMNKKITSTKNPYIKNVSLLVHKARERRPQGRFVAEGFREVSMALCNGFEAEALFHDETLTGLEQIEELSRLSQSGQPEIISVNRAVFEKIAYRTTVPNVVGLFKMKVRTLDEIKFRQAPFVLVVEHTEKPGNLGAMLRTADAAGVDAVIVCDPQTDVYNPNTIRASLGAVFSLPVVAVSNEEALNWLRQNDITVMTTSLEASKLLYDCDLKVGCALVLGSESAGVTDFWLQNADQRIIIPMAGQVDSLNLSASAAVVLFEVVRQRASDKG